MKYFTDPSKVIEMGSGYINGTIKAHFRCANYIGVDWRNAYCCDLLSLAHEVSFEPETFDTVVSASMLEHDPHWEKSLFKMVEILKPFSNSTQPLYTEFSHRESQSQQE